jgi:hypothetical protein
MQPLTEGEPYAAVRFDGLDPVKGARFLVERAALTGCTNSAAN